MAGEPLNHNVLIVEDDASLRKVMAGQLTREGFSVWEAENGEEGLKIALKKYPHLILLDIMIPKMDGLTMMKKLRTESTWGKKVPIILLTNLSPDEQKVMNSITQDKPAYYLVKTNCDMADIVAKVKETLKV